MAPLLHERRPVAVRAAALGGEHLRYVAIAIAVTVPVARVLVRDGKRERGLGREGGLDPLLLLRGAQGVSSHGQGHGIGRRLD